MRAQRNKGRVADGRIRQFSKEGDRATEAWFLAKLWNKEALPSLEGPSAVPSPSPAAQLLASELLAQANFSYHFPPRPFPPWKIKS